MYYQTLQCLSLSFFVCDCESNNKQQLNLSGQHSSPSLNFVGSFCFFFLTFWPRIYFTLLLRKNMFPTSAAGSCNERKKETPDTVSDWMVNTAQCLPAEKQDISLRSRQGTKTQPKRLNIGKSACHLQR